MYEFSCTRGQGKSLDDFSYQLPETAYDQIIGLDCNSVSSNVYEVELAVRAKNVGLFCPYSTYTITFQRYSLFDEHDFTNEEIKHLAEQCFDEFNYANSNSTCRADTSIMPKVSAPASVYLAGSGDRNYVSDMHKLTR